MLARHLGQAGGIACELSPTDTAKVVHKTEGYSGSDMRALIQEACQVRIEGQQLQPGSHHGLHKEQGHA